MASSLLRAPVRSTSKAPQIYPLILSSTLPSSEDIAKAIWRRQRDALGADAIAHNVEWRDQSMPAKFWDEFLLDANAVLSLFLQGTRQPTNYAN